MSEQSETVILDDYAARSCPVKVQNRFDQTVGLPDATGTVIPTHGDSEKLAEMFAGSREFRAHALAVLAKADGEVADLRSTGELTRCAREDLTRDAVARGVDVIISPTLPTDVAGHRQGSPHALIRGVDRPDGRPGYLPLLVKRHAMTEKLTKPNGTVGSALTSPRTTSSLVDARFKFKNEADLLQIAHFWRMLESTGWEAGGTPLGALLGTEYFTPVDDGFSISRNKPGPKTFDVNRLGIVWVALTEREILTYSLKREDHWRKYSALERYDHEHGFRVKVAQTAAKRTGAADDPSPMVSPIYVRDCESCQWWSVCAPQLGADDISFGIEKTPLDVREISTLRSLGVRTVNDLAEADLDELLPQYLPLVQHRARVDSRLVTAKHRATMLRDGIVLDRVTTDPIKLPKPGIEIDLDIETSASDRVYLWGFWLRDAGSDDPGHYRAFARFEDLDEISETLLAAEALEWLNGLLDEHPEAKVYHYSTYETTAINRLAQRGDPAIQRLADRVDRSFFDLFRLVDRHFFGLTGLGLKVTAPLGAGFEWRDDDPGGANSLAWFEQAIHDPDPEVRKATAQRILEYNEDDVRATVALRDWLRTDPGSVYDSTYTGSAD